MDIALKAKRAIASLSAGFIALSAFVFSGGTALADTFLDVTPDMWSYNYVEQGVDDGYFDAGVKFRPFDAFNRAELVKTVCVISDCLAGYKAPATPTFKDVKAGEWYYDYVEALAAQGVVNGYTDAQGVPTGEFGPGNVVLRNEFVKLAVLAFNIPETLTPANQFKDVVNGTWYEPYFTTAYNQSVIDGYTDAQGKMTGYAGPGDPLTREQAAKVLYTAQHPELRGGQTCDPNVDPNCKDGVCDPNNANDPDCEVPPCPANDPNCVPPSTGTLEVSLNANTPKGSTVPLNATHVPLFSFDLSAVGDNVAVSQILVNRAGVGDADDWEGLYLYNGTQRVTTQRTISSDTNQATFPLKNFSVPAGKTVTLTLVGDLSATAVASSQHYFFVLDAKALTTNAKAVNGTFSVQGNTFTVGSVTVSDATLSKGPAPVNAKLGQKQAEVASFKIQAGVNDIDLNQITLNQGGTLSSEDMANCTLLRGTDELAKTAAFSGDLLTFVLDKPYLIDSGQTRTFYVNCDILGGKDAENIILYLEEDADLVVTDKQYGYGANVINSFTQNVANTVEVEGGDVVVVDNGPVSKKIARNSTNNHLLDFSVTANRDLVVQNTYIQLDIEGPSGKGPSLPVGVGSAVNGAAFDTSSFDVDDGTKFTQGDMIKVEAASGTVYAMITSIAGNTISTGLAAGDTVADNAVVTEVDPYDSLTNVRLVDADTNVTLAGPLTDANASSTLIDNAGDTSDSFFKVHPEDWDLFGGKTRNLSIQADVDSNMASGYKVRAQVRFSDGGTTSYIKDFNANQVVSTDAIIGAGSTALAGQYMFTASNTLDATLSASPTSKSYVKGATDVPALGVTLEAGEAGDTTLKRLDVRVYADSGPVNAWGSATGDTAGNSVVSTMALYDGNTLVAGPKTTTLVNVGGGAGFDADSGDYYKAQFDSLNIAIPAGQTKTLVAKVNLANILNSTTFLALDVAPATDITAEDKDGNSITASGDTNLNPGTDKNPELTILATGGSLTASVVDAPDARIMVAGSTKQNVANYDFDAVNEDFKVETLTAVVDTDGNDFGDALPTGFNAVKEVTIEYPDMNNVMQTKTVALTSGGVAKFGNLDFYVPAGKTVPLKMYANISTKASVGEAISGKVFRIGLKNVSNGDTTFRAVGQESNQVENFDGGTEVSNSTNVNEHVVRTTVPTFVKAATNPNMQPGETPLYSFTVTADNAGAVKFGRFVFDIQQSGGANIDTEDFRFFRGIAVLDNVNIYSAAVGDVSLGQGSLGAGPLDDKIIVSLNAEESVSPGSPKTYTLKATPTNAAVDDVVTTQLAIGDESTPVAGIAAGSTCGAGNNVLCSTGNGNTGRIYDTGAGEALFVATNTEFADTATTARNIIWSDSSADAHNYPTVTLGTVTQATGTYDWTNGYLLGITDLSSQAVQKQ